MNLRPVEHFFPHFLTALLCVHSKAVKKYSIGQRFTCTEVTSYKIHALILTFTTGLYARDAMASPYQEGQIMTTKLLTTRKHKPSHHYIAISPIPLMHKK